VPCWASSDQCESDNTKFNTPAPHSHLRPCNTNESHDTRERKWLIRPNILRGQQIYTVIQAVHSLIYIVAKRHFFSVVTIKYNKIFNKCEGCTHFCETAQRIATLAMWLHDYMIMLNMQYVIQLYNQLHKIFVKIYLSTLQILSKQVSDNWLYHIYQWQIC
jgi:hypothetical protein